MYDLIIIGGGVAGMTAAIYAARAGMSTLIIEKAAFGGQVAITAKIENYPSYKEIEGWQLAADVKAQVDALGVECRSADVTRISKDNDIFTVASAADSFQAKAVIIANGVKRHGLGIKGEEEFLGRGVSRCAVCDGNFFRGRSTAVIGSGNAALEDAVYLAKLCKDVTVVFRQEKPSAAQRYVDLLSDYENIRLLPRHIPAEVKGDRLVTALTVKDLDTDEETDLEVSGVFAALKGMSSDNGIYKEFVELDDRGYIVTDSEMRTKTPGLFAAGDTRQKTLRQIVTACSDGAQAATSAQEYLSMRKAK